MQQTESDRIKSDLLTVFMQVLKMQTMVLAAECKADPSRMGLAFAAAAENARLDPTAREILAQLADGFSMIASTGQTRN